MTTERILVTGAAGFIGFHLCRRLLADGCEVVGLDNLSPYYDVGLKEARLAILTRSESFRFARQDMADAVSLEALFREFRPRLVANMAAQPGVRYSLENPSAYITSNVVGFANLLESCTHGEVAHLVHASSSSVYGANTRVPFSVHDSVDHPVSLYAATKKADELMAHTYSHLFQLPCTCLRFFTVYGPWGRPDMAIFKFTRAILAGEPIDVYGNGRMKRDFTYVDDIVEGVTRVLARPAQPNPAWQGDAPDPGSSSAPWRVYNLGNHSPVELLRFIGALEEAIGRKAQLNMLPMQPGDVTDTHADMTAFIRDFDFAPATPIDEGVRRFVEWYTGEYRGA